MRILISNDDGINAPGIQALTEVVAAMGDVVVVAPDRQRSASSHGISLHRKLYAEKVNFRSGVLAYSVSGTPVDCVKWAMVELGRSVPFDLMVSGINEGPNLATDVLYSGTLAAAGEAALQGVQAVAFSLLGPIFRYPEAAEVAGQLLKRLHGKVLPPDTFLSVNLPSHGLAGAPWAVTRLGARTYRDSFVKDMDADGRMYYHYDGDEVNGDDAPDTDVVAVKTGHVSITPLRYRFTDEEMVAKVSFWLNHAASEDALQIPKNLRTGDTFGR